jgi:hypothetical protein
MSKNSNIFEKFKKSLEIIWDIRKFKIISRACENNPKHSSPSGMLASHQPQCHMRASRFPEIMI